MRFGSGSRSREDVVEKFNKLIQEKWMDTYTNLKKSCPYMTAMSSNLPESYYISSFVSGFKDDVKPMLNILKPVILIQAFEQAKKQEESNLAMIKRSRMTSKMSVPIGVSKWTGQEPLNPSNQIKNDTFQGLKKPSETLYEQRRRLEWCSN